MELGLRGERRAAMRLARELLATRGPKYRSAVFRGAAATGLRGLISHAEHAIRSDAGRDVAFAAVYALGHLGARRSVALLIGTLRSKARPPRIRAAAAEALGEIGDQRAEAALRCALSDRAAEVRFFSAFALGLIGSEDSLAELARVARTDAGVVPTYGAVATEARRARREIRRRAML